MSARCVETNSCDENEDSLEIGGLDTTLATLGSTRPPGFES